MQIRFLLGPAGSGKTFRCLAEIRDALKASPDGPPLVLLTPKQATFQLERQLLSDPALPGYTRLQILSFDRLAEFIVAQLGDSTGELLEEEGRVMILRALLGRHQAKLKVFHATARLPGFAQQLNLLLKEFQRARIPPRHLSDLAAKLKAESTLAGKLHDTALLLNAYQESLRTQRLQDANCLLDLAADVLRENLSSGKTRLRVAGLWLDGFAEMTPQELDLLTAFLPICDHARLAFCLDTEAGDSWLSGWAVVNRTFHECCARATALPGCEVVVESLKRDSDRSRFRDAPALQQLEKSWAGAFAIGDIRLTSQSDQEVTLPLETKSLKAASVRLVTCSDPEAEATFAAREILRFARAGGRFREATVLVRRLDGYHEIIRRVFARYDIPFFLDRREPVAHHPLAELSRYALRLAAFGWQHDDWFGALKTGLATADEEMVDRLENEALARGWQGTAWLQPLKIAEDSSLEKSVNRALGELLPPFVEWNRALAAVQHRPTARQLTTALRQLWSQLNVEDTLDRWSTVDAPESPIANSQSQIANRQQPIANSQSPAANRQSPIANRQSQIDNPQSAIRNPQSIVHSTVLDQMQAWLENVDRAFGDQPLTLAEWLPILESGLANLSVGVIPPALDQVLIGAIDRSRNPELKLALLLGWNETVFPAPPPPGPLLTEPERDLLAGENVRLGPGPHDQIGHERYYAYIACTRAREQVVITRAARDADGRPLNPSLFIEQIKQITGATEEEFQWADYWPDSERAFELAPFVLRMLTEDSSTVGSDKGASSPRPSPPSDGGEGVGPRLSADIPSLRDAGAGRGSGRGVSVGALIELPVLAPLVRKWRALRAAASPGLSPAATEKLYGRELRTSVSGLEDFAACPFRFFAKRGLRLQERKEFQFDDRDKGSFQHEVLREFHRRVLDSGRRWRDLGTDEASRLIAEIGRELLPEFAGGKMQATAAARFTSDHLIARLQRLITALIEWMPQYGFDPIAVEIGFDDDKGELPSWRLELGDGRVLLLRGRIDRVDVCRVSDDTALAVVMDYKSRVRKLDATKFYHGLELQLLSYLGVLKHLHAPAAVFGVSELQPAGVFFIPLNGGGPKSAAARVSAPDAAGRRAGYQHSGRFLGDELGRFDNRGQDKGDQFKFKILKSGAGFSKSGNEALPKADFEALREQVEAHLRDYGRRIFAGEISVAPFRIGRETACDYCDLRAACRFDPWTQLFRRLRPPPKTREVPARTGAAMEAVK